MDNERFLIVGKRSKNKEGEKENESCGAELESRYQNEVMITDRYRKKYRCVYMYMLTYKYFLAL